MYDVIVIGAGPAGVMAALTASEYASVLLIDKNNDIGKKLFLTGGGRCNVTNLKSHDNFVKEIHNGKYFYSILNQFDSAKLMEYFSDRGVVFKEEDRNRIFPVSNSALEIINVLKEELKKKKVATAYNENVVDIIDGDSKTVITNKGEYQAKKIIIATGGKSYPLTGSTGDGYYLAKKLGHKVTELLPAETYIITEEKFPLPGISCDVSITFNNYKVEETLLFTHRGLSGPVIFKLSEFLYKEISENKKPHIEIDFLPDFSSDELLSELEFFDGKKEAKSWLRIHLITRLADFLLGNYADKKLSTLSKKELLNIVKRVKCYDCLVTNTGSLEEAIVTSGGVALDEINTKTLESKIVPNLYFAGEVLDFHGPMGGYNLTIAFATGYVAGLEKKKPLL